jgi:MFS transporter, FSR family, fosmidomycin resistance protein
VLPIISVAVSGTSSVLYGSVPELVPVQQRERAFGILHRRDRRRGLGAPALYGLLGDAIGLSPAMLLVAAIVLLTLPMAWRLTPFLDLN